ncbi:hypothetical protein DEU56DRAFT_757693 [Suillus clintonianus]|uniref:uncharacterized protein n=1 Tax=Suillus clintonianus TaxID=1904413 RepID=UPI001B871364|nr:uncharacterized protein DEU56DRAFT_757693 [Suillus clintonianus]KAG2131068.1 hypothetical protein DEU56DRAFT_757693 [Suillus clintonianus]
MSSDDIQMSSVNHKATAPTTTTPTQHMNTDSRVNKHTRPTSTSQNPSPQTAVPNTTQTQDVATTNTSSPSPNKCLNIEHKNQLNTPVATDQWQFLCSNDSTTEVSVSGIRTLDSGFKITATLPGGFPIPQLGQSTWRNISQILKDKWCQKEGAKVWVRTYRAKHENNAQGTVAKLKDAITKIIGDSDATDLIVSTPMAAVELIEHLPPPWHYLISGIPTEAIERLLRLQPLPTYAFTLENFSFPDSKTTNKEIAEIVKDTIRSNLDVLQFIHENIPFPDAEATLHTTESIKVTSLTLAHSKTLKETVWNIYFNSPLAFTLKQYFDWTSILQSFFYILEDHGYGTARHDAQFVCVGCGSDPPPQKITPMSPSTTGTHPATAKGPLTAAQTMEAETEANQEVI